MNMKDRRGFTMVELLVVIAMLLLLAGSVTSSVGAASRRAKVQQATTEIQEMTKAILAYENYGRVSEDSPLAAHAKGDSWFKADESTMGFILGREALKNGQSGNIPVLFNAEIKQGHIMDPWGKPYEVKIRKAEIDPKEESSDSSLTSCVMFPNYNRLPARKR